MTTETTPTPPDNGGPAYPLPDEVGMSEFGNHGCYRGMSIRTAIAAQCLAGYDSKLNSTSTHKAQWAVEDADALIAELTKDGGTL